MERLLAPRRIFQAQGYWLFQVEVLSASAPKSTLDPRVPFLETNLSSGDGMAVLTKERLLLKIFHTPHQLQCLQFLPLTSVPHRSGWHIAAPRCQLFPWREQRLQLAAAAFHFPTQGKVSPAFGTFSDCAWGVYGISKCAVCLA